jgi:L-serine dehydratase
MPTSVFDLFKIGIGPSSSHTVGPMRAAAMFVASLVEDAVLARVAAIKVELFGSLGATGRGHGTDKAVLLGLMGEVPESVDLTLAHGILDQVRATGQIMVNRTHAITFTEKDHLLLFGRRMLPYHPNGLRITACDAQRVEIAKRVYYSVGGGFVVNDRDVDSERDQERRTIGEGDARIPFPFHSADELLRLCAAAKISISELMMRNEQVARSEVEIRAKLLEIWDVMQASVRRGCETDGILPGGLKVPRRAPQMFRRLLSRPEAGLSDPLTVIDWVNLYALAVNEENAAGGRVVTAPTNGAAGIIPAVLHYYRRFTPMASDDGVVRFLLTAGAIGALYKENASISGAEVGCQGEVGSACSMAAGALAELMGGTPEQAENAAEIGMEHNLGLTCDPIGGLVQVPCIERNAMASVKAINAARLSLSGNGHHFVSLDKVIQTMRETGADMKLKYKETSRGGLALTMLEAPMALSVGLPEC